MYFDNWLSYAEPRDSLLVVEPSLWERDITTDSVAVYVGAYKVVLYQCAGVLAAVSVHGVLWAGQHRNPEFDTNYPVMIDDEAWDAFDESQVRSVALWTKGDTYRDPNEDDKAVELSFRNADVSLTTDEGYLCAEVNLRTEWNVE